MKKVICFLFACFMMQSVVVFAEGNTDLGLNAKSAILMEESTGNILYESNPDEITYCKRYKSYDYAPYNGGC